LQGEACECYDIIKKEFDQVFDDVQESEEPWSNQYQLRFRLPPLTL